jgi:XTP/dITP diphosphohydrolase
MEILFATSNANKVREANIVGVPHGVSFRQIGLMYPEIRAETVSEVALDGARYIGKQLSKPAIVEDSGLFIEALGGFPGPYSAFVYKRIGCEGILRLMGDRRDRRARFISAVGYSHGGEVCVFEGVCEGEIAFGSFGGGGFGYDPVFLPQGFDRTFAQDEQVKNDVSHRRVAIDKLCMHVRGLKK